MVASRGRAPIASTGDGDPIGIAGVPQAADEYDSWLPQIVQELRKEVSAEELAGFLGGYVDGYGLQRPPDADLIAARRMREWYASSTARFAKPS